MPEGPQQMDRTSTNGGKWSEGPRAHVPGCMGVFLQGGWEGGRDAEGGHLRLTTIGYTLLQFLSQMLSPQCSVPGIATTLYMETLFFFTRLHV